MRCKAIIFELGPMDWSTNKGQWCCAEHRVRKSEADKAYRPSNPRFGRGSLGWPIDEIEGDSSVHVILRSTVHYIHMYALYVLDIYQFNLMKLLVHTYQNGEEGSGNSSSCQLLAFFRLLTCGIWWRAVAWMRPDQKWTSCSAWGRRWRHGARMIWWSIWKGLGSIW